MKAGDFFITGIQQIGVGTTSVYDSWKWYIDIFGVDIRILEDDTVAERMLPYTGGTVMPSPFPPRWYQCQMPQHPQHHA